jgi:hypothetical protein
VRSTTHLVHAASWLRHTADRDRQPLVVEYLGSGTFLGRDNVDPADAEHYLSLAGRLEWRPAGGAATEGDVAGRPVLLCVGAPGLRAYAALVRRHPAAPPEVVVVDEGLGSYGTWRTRRAAYLRQGGREPRTTVRAVAVAAGSRVLTGTRWALYQERHGGWRVSEPVAAEFRRHLGGLPAPAGRVVYLTQPWPALGLVDEGAYRAHLEAVDGACATAGLSLTVRPHPAEDPGRYAGLVSAARTGPAELDRAVSSAAAVLGADSTALLNLAAIHGTPALRVRVPGLERLTAGLAPRQRRLLDAFLPPPRTAEELGTALAAIGPPPTASA